MKIRALIISTTLLVTASGVKIPKSFSANFTQKVTSQKKKVIKYSGTIALNSDGGLKWSYKKPSKKEVCSDGKLLIVVDHALEQISHYKVKNTLDLVSILKNAKHHKENIYVATYEKVLYTFAIDKQGRISQIAYKDNLDATVNVHFQKMRYSNKPQPSKKITCQYPKAYDII